MKTCKLLKSASLNLMQKKLRYSLIMDNIHFIRLLDMFIVRLLCSCASSCVVRVILLVLEGLGCYCFFGGCFNERAVLVKN